ncbi:MAG: GDSL-type esterase/lipase family protein [Bacillota bacterium]|jgi:lysophospholipase L1-like esterase|nr:GDSL-type esterase/lipase family protein [Bacillota bacterium]NLL26245.1 hypothetical protein [Erysipelotrichia bacterium]
MDKWEIIVILIILLAPFIGWYLYQNGFSKIIRNPEVQPEQIKVACVGDSVTYGYGIKNWPENNYPKQLQNLLGNDYHVANFGVSGCCVGKKTNMPYLKTKTYLNSLEYEADILVFMIGSNDSKPFNWQNKEKFKEEYSTLLETYIRKKNIKIFLCTISTAFFPKGRSSGVTNYGIQPEIVDIIVEVIKEIADEKEYELIDINKITAYNFSWFVKDNVHPDKEGALSIAKEIFKHIKNNP